MFDIALNFCSNKDCLGLTKYFYLFQISLLLIQLFSLHEKLTIKLNLNLANFSQGLLRVGQYKNKYDMSAADVRVEIE